MAAVLKIDRKKHYRSLVNFSRPLLGMLEVSHNSPGKYDEIWRWCIIISWIKMAAEMVGLGLVMGYPEDL